MSSVMSYIYIYGPDCIPRNQDVLGGFAPPSYIHIYTHLMSSVMSTLLFELTAQVSATCGAAHGTRYVRHARGWYAYPVRTVREGRGKLPCASGTYSTQEAGRTAQHA